MAELFCRNATKGVLCFDLLLAIAAGFALGVPFGVAAVLSLFVCVGVTLRVKQILGGITGDILGLLCEVSQLTFLFVCIIFSTRGYV